VKKGGFYLQSCFHTKKRWVRTHVHGVAERSWLWRKQKPSKKKHKKIWTKGRGRKEGRVEDKYKKQTNKWHKNAAREKTVAQGPSQEKVHRRD